MKKRLSIILYLIIFLLVYIGCKDNTLKQDFNITFVDYDGTVLKKEIVQEGSAAFPPNGLKRIGYEFTKWDKDYKNVKEDQIIRASYVEATPVEIGLYINDIFYKKVKLQINENILLKISLKIKILMVGIMTVIKL